MFRCVTNITIAQQEKNGDGRNSTYLFDFVKSFSAESTWANLTNKGTIVFPKNIYVRDEFDNLVGLGGVHPSKQIQNLFQRGDKITLRYGYIYYRDGNEIEETSEIFKGYISVVGSKVPVELEFEDNMWLLKQTPCKPQVWPKSKTVEDLMKSLLTGTGFTVNGLTKTTVGDLIIQNESVAQLLARLRKDYSLEAYFKGDELRIGTLVYVDEPKEHTFVFQQNIISDDLSFQRKEDVKLSVVCESINIKDGGTNKKGVKKTKQERLSVLVYFDEQGKAQYKVKEKDKPFPENLEGERRKLFFPNVTDAKTLAKYGEDEMKKYYYTGFKGKFTTFAIPCVQFGDTVKLVDRVLPDRDGTYRVKAVEYSGGTEGHRQTIELHYKEN